jgi:metallo-beta-lactamase family protein
MLSLTFLGAAGTVTGSRYLVEAHGVRLLVDAGLFQGKKELRLRNWADFPVPPSSLSAVVLTHAHIDHTGYLPRLVKGGFAGPTFATPPTRRLLHALLPDAAKLQEEEARFANKVGSTRHTPALPLFTTRDAQEALGTLQPLPFGQRATIHPGIDFCFHRQGHILGAAAVELRIKIAGGEHITVYFSGDVGRYDVPILKAPEPYPGSTYLVVESTYGDTFHDAGDPREQLTTAISHAAQTNGVILVPAFAVDRTQELLYFLRELIEDGAIAPLPIFLDSPMAREATAVYQSCALEHDAEMRELLREGEHPLVPQDLTIVRSVDESKHLNSIAGPALIISASGMATGGRILHHLRHRLPDPTTTVVFVGYQAEGTRGRRILEGESEVKIFGEMVPVRAQIRNIPSLSAHADADELTIWASRAERAPESVFVTHGEPAASQGLAERFTKHFGWRCLVPSLEETVAL